MTPEQALGATRVARAAWPAQRWDEYTIDIWVESLLDQDYELVRGAITRLVRRQTFASVAEILQEVRRHRRNIIDHAHNRRILGELETAKSTTATQDVIRECRSAFDAVAPRRDTTEATP